MRVTDQAAYFVPNVAPPAGLFLDLFPGSDLAYSVRKLRTAYAGPCMRIMRTSDSAETDIGFVSNYVDEAAISAFFPGGNCQLVKWYDQSGVGNFAVQATALFQPIAMQTGVLQKVNSVLAPKSGYMEFSPSSGASNWSVFQISKRAAIGQEDFFIAGPTPTVYSAVHYTDNNYYGRGRENTFVSSAVDNNANQNSIVTIHTAVGGVSAWNNGSAIAGTNGASISAEDFIYLGLFASAGIIVPNASLQEMIKYPIDQSANRVAMVLNQRTYFAF